MGTFSPSQQLHVRKDQDANTFILVQNATNGLNANAVVRTQADVAVQNFQSHAQSRTLAPLGRPSRRLERVPRLPGQRPRHGHLRAHPLHPRHCRHRPHDLRRRLQPHRLRSHDGQSDSASFLDASSRVLKQDVRPLGPAAAADALAGLEPVTFAYTGAPGDERVGFIAEDVPELVATPSRQTLSALEIVAVLTRVVQEQQQAIAELTARLTALEAKP